MNILKYYFRTANFQLIKQNRNKNIIVFTHGILSHAKTAFKRVSKPGHLWDILEETCDISSFDIGLFSYGKIDIAYILEGDWPINNLLRLSHELHGYISEYKNVFLVGHSQGGLLAKTYATQFINHQGIHLLTLHTPHRNKSFSVMRFNDVDIWGDRACFYVPHIFCASINDNIIVKPDNALASCHDKSYLSTDTNKHRLGHSHLSRSPDIDLLNLYSKDIHSFVRSGLSRELIDSSDGIKWNQNSVGVIKIIYSRHKNRIEKLTSTIDQSEIIIQPWKNLTNLSEQASKPDPHCIVLHLGSSINYFVKHINFHTQKNGIKLEIQDIDTAYPSSLKIINNSLCQQTFELRYNEENPYKGIPFDIHDFTKDSLIKCDQFLNIFTNMLFTSNTEMQRFKSPKDYKNHLSGIYKEAAEQWRTLVVQDIFACLSSIEITPKILEELLCTLVKKIRDIRKDTRFSGKYKDITKGKWMNYLDIYSLIKSIFHNNGHNIDVLDIEVIISKIFKSDGAIYRLDKYYKILFNDQRISNAIA